MSKSEAKQSVPPTSSNPLDDWFSQKNPCRCGYDGTGEHQCHSGRDPRWPEARCPNEAKPRLIGQPVCLAGAQMKVGGVIAAYCEAHHLEAFGGFEETTSGGQ